MSQVPPGRPAEPGVAVAAGPAEAVAAPSVSVESPELRRVGPGGPMAPDNAFAAMLLDLWERVTRAGGAVGFSPSATRSDIAGEVAETIQAVKGGRRRGVALTAGRSLIGFAALEPGRGQACHLGTVDVVLVDPVAQGRGSGARLIGELADIAAESGIVRLELVTPADDRLTKLFARAGFREWARRPAGRLLDGTLQDDVFLYRLLGEPVPK